MAAGAVHAGSTIGKYFPLFWPPGQCNTRTTWVCPDHQPLELPGSAIFIAAGRRTRSRQQLLSQAVRARTGNRSAFKPAADRMHFQPRLSTVVEGDATVATHLLSLKWNSIFFTGSQDVGKAIEKAVAGRHIPLTLELGGKNPCVVDASGLNEVTASRIVWGKFLNAGQTCVAPDTVWVEAACLEPLVALLSEQIEAAFGTDPASSPDYGRIGHPRQLERCAFCYSRGKCAKVVRSTFPRAFWSLP